MAENAHTIDDLHQMQAAPLSVKIRMTQSRIRDWVNEFGEDGVYVSFSGGKDSTVLLHIVREMYPNIPVVFCDTGLEYPEIREFVKTFDNVTWLKPKMTFRQVIEKYGYPFISKEVAECVWGARKYLKSVIEQMDAPDRQTDRQTDRQARSGDISAQEDFSAKESTLNRVQIVDEITLSHKMYQGGGYENKYRRLRGIGLYSSGKNSQAPADMGSRQTCRNVTNWGGRLSPKI